MSLKTLTLPDSNVYKTDKVNFEPIDLFLDALPCSKKFDLMLGYFSSTAIYTISKGFSLFLFNGGKMRMITNHIYSPKDKAVLIKGKNQTQQHFNFSITDYKKIRDSLDDYGIHFFNCLAWLISNNRIEIKIIKPKGSIGIAHYKSGLFDDGQNKLGFNGSCNFTHSGLVLNHEQITISKSFGGEAEVNAIKEFEDDFEETFLGKNKNVEYIEFEELEEAIKSDFGNRDIQELLRDEKRLNKRSGNINTRIQQKMDNLDKKIEDILYRPQFPFPEPRVYQNEAYNRWVNNDYQGIFAMATGTGKTVTALNCILEQWKTIGSYQGLILVPTLTLVEQWEEEALSFNFQDIITISSKKPWTQELASKLTYAKKLPDTNFIVIVTYASFSKTKFQSFLKRFPERTILIADEGHNIASPKLLEVFPNIHLKKRLCLSATPKRIYDIEGTLAMEQFFNDSEPYIFQYSMEEAIDKGILCEYYYYPHIVILTFDEFKEYEKISKDLIKYFDFKRREYKKSKAVEILLLNRKRIIQRAENKLAITISILSKQYQKNGNLKYTLLYAPEGFNSAKEECQDEISESEEGLRLIDIYTSKIAEINKSIRIDKIVGGMKNKKSVLKHFEKGNIHLLASMKCLDEGVDIPRTEFAIFCSSTGNPRQFIQRRGRVLRKDKRNEKHFATIHDLVVIPDYTANAEDSDSYNMERSLVSKELERVMYFSSLSINPYQTDEIFENVCNHYDLNIYTIKSKLKFL